MDLRARSDEPNAPSPHHLRGHVGGGQIFPDQKPLARCRMIGEITRDSSSQQGAHDHPFTCSCCLSPTELPSPSSTPDIVQGSKPTASPLAGPTTPRALIATPPTTRWSTSLSDPGDMWTHLSMLHNSWQISRSFQICPHCR